MTEPRTVMVVDDSATVRTQAGEATEVSGRGVGLGAVRLECSRLGGLLMLEEGRDGGTLVRVTIPDCSESARGAAAE